MVAPFSFTFPVPFSFAITSAYYTKEDITEYISKNTIIPFLFDAAKKKCRKAFEGPNSFWRLLQEDPDRYIYPAVRHGLTCNARENPSALLKERLEMPPEIATGLEDISKRTEWNKTAPEEYGLPTEIWREVVARRGRYEEVRAKLVKGEITDINDLITYNLDIRQFAQDVIENCESPELLRAFWYAINGRIPEKSNEKVQVGITILDPTCGSGAFLFAALNILEPLYEACLDRMETFVNEDSRTRQSKGKPARQFANFQKILDRMYDKRQHPNPRYFILKNIILNNLYGVDIMEEAVEICKLRLFLKLIAQIETAEEVEPLPDIDFNIRAGNTLVGFASLHSIKLAIEKDQKTTKLPDGKKGQQDLMVFPEDDQVLQRIQERAENADRAFNLFRRMQVTEDMDSDDFREAKEELCDRLEALEEELNQYLACEYSIDSQRENKAYDHWLETHKPFHWFVEFFGILKNGGFDVIIGNPPYVEYKDVKKSYQVINFQTFPCGDLYAFCTERALTILRTNGLLGLIVPISMFGTDGFISLQRIAVSSLHPIWISSYANRPSQLFAGAQKRLTVVLGRLHGGSEDLIFTAQYYRWKKEEFDKLFKSRVRYSPDTRKLQYLPLIYRETW